jgi:L,D-peptidoglycan transpeptidase YkuD (ErfK/YbiS/YcfS/YnhG family)
MILFGRKSGKWLPGMGLLLALAAFLSLAACATRTAVTDRPVPYAQTARMENTGQILLVTEESFLFLTARKIYPLEKTDSSWRQAMKPIEAVIGRNGFAPPGEKREGDGCTPSGVFRLKTAFGYPPSVPTQMPYRQSQDDDLWIDDPNDPEYNRLVRENQTKAASYERMKRDDDLYKYGIAIEYNTEPVIKGLGSAIFLHVWRGANSATAGCVAASEDDILKILGWLNPVKNPVMLINPDEP